MLVSGPRSNAGPFQHETVPLAFGGMIESFRICIRHRIEVFLLSCPRAHQLVPVDERFICGKAAVLGDTI
jgi:hypothetical protein